MLGNFREYELSLNECFFYQHKIMRTSPSEENIKMCEYCNKSFDLTSNTKLLSGSKILIIILNRGKGIHNNIKIEFSEELNLSEFIEYNRNIWKYHLIGVISLIGEDLDKGHFIAFCRNPISNQWYKYNDEFINQVIDFKKEVIDSYKPYILFYQLNE